MRFSPPGFCLLLCLLIINAAQGAVQAIDAEGRTVTLSTAATRVVALAPHIVENLASVGALNTIVGTVQFSDYPEPATHIPRLGSVGAISLEGIVALQADLVVLWGSGTPAGLRAGIERLGLPYFVDEIRSLEDLRESLEALGTLTGNAEKGALVSKQLDSVLDDMAPNRNTPDDHRPGVFLQLWDQPLQSIGKAHLLNEVIERCGGHSITGRIPGLAPQVSMEQVLTDNPALIIVESPAQAEHWKRYPQLRALRENRIIVINPDLLHRPTLRLLQGMETICTEVGHRKPEN
ncbi:helical backbone metal receptor [Congregibacter sp.]|uniref:helical backbone metal receptor n=1 Tax=Congregibacter sp. TaxID=2744308 RepID=UPI003F6BB11C